MERIYSYEKPNNKEKSRNCLSKKVYRQVLNLEKKLL